MKTAHAFGCDLVDVFCEDLERSHEELRGIVVTAIEQRDADARAEPLEVLQRLFDYTDNIMGETCVLCNGVQTHSAHCPIPDAEALLSDASERTEPTAKQDADYGRVNPRPQDWGDRT